MVLSACQQNQNQFQGYIEGYFRYLASNSPGFLSALLVQRGTPVKAGQVLFVLDNKPEVFQVTESQQKFQQAQAQLADVQKGQRPTILQGIEQQINQAQAELAFAQKTFERYQILIQKESISKQQFDQARSDYERTSARLKELLANLNEAKLGSRVDVIKSAEAAKNAASTEIDINAWYLEKKSIASPADGTVFDTFYRQGEYIQSGRPVVSLLVPNDNRVIFYVAEPMLSRIKLGDQVRVTCDGCKQSYYAIITFISSQAEFTPPIIFSETERRKFVYRVEAKFSPQNAKEVNPGQPVDVFIE